MPFRLVGQKRTTHAVHPVRKTFTNWPGKPWFSSLAPSPISSSYFECSFLFE